MSKLDPIIAVKDVRISSEWYQHVLGCRSLHGGHEFDILVDDDNEVLLCLHRWGTHEHPTMIQPVLPPGNGIILYFRTENLPELYQKVQQSAIILAEALHFNTNSLRQEFSLRDPDGYYITISEYHTYEG